MNFAGGGTSKVIFSVVKKGVDERDDQLQPGHPVPAPHGRRRNVAGSSRLSTAGGSWTGPDYTAVNPDSNAGLQVTGLPANLVSVGGFVYITEIYTRHTLITPFDRFGASVPAVLYSIAYF